nr:MAG TPA: hypothetical protein [Caudoviricetes sp.]
MPFLLKNTLIAVLCQSEMINKYVKRNHYGTKRKHVI